MSNFHTHTRTILREVDQVLRYVDTDQVERLVNAILDAKPVLVYGLGREGLAMRGFAMRLMHLGFPVAVVGDMTTPPLGPDGLFLVACGPGYLATVEALAGVAKSAGARIFMFTAQPGAILPQQADELLVLPAQTMAQDKGASSEQAMGSAFEQALWICCDAVIQMLLDRTGQVAEDLRLRHTNME